MRHGENFLSAQQFALQNVLSRVILEVTAVLCTLLLQLFQALLHISHETPVCTLAAAHTTYCPAGRWGCPPTVNPFVDAHSASFVLHISQYARAAV